MCLIVDDSSFPYETDEDIVVYKVLLMDGVLYSPFRLYPYVLGDMVKTELQDSPFIIEDFDGEEEVVELQVDIGIHSFVKLGDAIAFTGVLPDTRTRGKRVVVVEGIVPRGSLCYRGVWFYDREYDSIVSDRIKLVRIIEMAP